MGTLNSIDQRTTLRNGVSMPWLGLGTWKARNGGEVEQAVQVALGLGYRLIDTASIYENESGVGQGVRNGPVPREEVFITSKVWNDDQGFDATLSAFDASLERLRMDYVDLYLVHWPKKGTYRDTWRALERIYAEGRAKAIGVSNFLIHHLKDVLADCEVVPMVNQIEFHPHLRQPDLVAFCQQQQIQLQAWAPLMKGEADELPEVQAVARKHGKSPSQVLLRWDLQHGVATIPKSTQQPHLAANADIFDFELSTEDIAALDGLDQNRRLGGHPDVFPN